jgi:tRNA U34 5-carboxymethylaminomethyl modifying enzyme MnmG/GidA
VTLHDAARLVQTQGVAGRACSQRDTRDLSSARACRAGEAPSTGLTEALVELGFETARLKTGTPARVDARTVDFSGLQAQPGDADVRWFSFDPEARRPLAACGRRRGRRPA